MVGRGPSRKPLGHRGSRRPLRWRRHVPRQGVSELIGTLLILGITVALASAVFVLVLTSPRPTQPNSDYFQVGLTASGSKLGGISIQLLIGPPLSGSVAETYVRIISQHLPHAITTPFSISSGLGGQTVWAPGQVWQQNLTTYSLPNYDNLTVVIDSNAHQVYFGVTPTPPVGVPYFTIAGVDPVSPAKSTSFVLFCGVQAPQGLGATNPVTANLTGVPGQASAHQALSYDTGSGLWKYTVSAGSTMSGTFTIVLTVVDRLGQTGPAVVVFTVGP